MAADLAALLAEVLSMRPPLTEAYRAQDRVLVDHGYHPTSPWWLEQLERLWTHPTAFRLVEQVGRRGGKSSTIVRVAVAEVVDRDWSVPPGDPCHVFAFFSVKRGEAIARLDGVEQVLRVRGIAHHRSRDDLGPYIRLADRPLEWRALPANFRTAVGFTLVGFVADELARWIDNESSSNPATHVLQAARPAMLSHMAEGAHEYLISSPMAEEGAHWDAVSQGDTADQVVAIASTWEANPTLSREDCERLARTEARDGEDVVMERDYGAVAQPLSAVGRLDPGLIVWLEQPPEPEPGDAVVSGSDLGMRRNSSAQCVAYLRGETYLVALVDEMQPEPGEPLRPTVVCSQHRANLERLGAASTMADGHYRESLREAFLGSELVVLDAPKQASGPIVRLRTLMQEGSVRVWCGEQMRERLSEQLRGTRLVPTPNGLSVLMQTARDGSHCDIVAALALCVWQQAGRRVPPPRPADYDAGYEELIRKHRKQGRVSPRFRR